MYGRRTYIVPISGLVGAVLVIALILSGKIVAAAGIAFPAAVIVFPLSYVFGDLLSEVYGYASTQRVVWGDFAAQLIWVVSYWIAAALPPATFWTHQQALETVLGATPRIASAGVSAYLVGEFLNAYVLARLKLAWNGRWPPLRLIGHL